MPIQPRNRNKWRTRLFRHPVVLVTLLPAVMSGQNRAEFQQILERLDRLLAADVAAMATAPEGAAAYFIKSSVWADTPMDRVFVAATRLAEVAHGETLRRFAAGQASWLELLAADVGPAMAKAVLCMGDGLYFNAMLARGPGGPPPEVEADVQSLLAAVERLRD